MIAINAIPRGGSISASVSGDPETCEFIIRSKGMNARIPVHAEALLAGEVQFVRASPPAVVRSTLRGADLAIIANTINVAVFSLMTRPEISRPEDLKGKKIGVTNLGDSPDLVLSLLLERWGLQRNRDLTVLGIRGGMPELMVSVSKGFVDGGMISAPSNLLTLRWMQSWFAAA